MTTILGTAAITATALLTAQPASAQVDLALRGGVAIPTSDLSDFQETGGHIGLGGGYWFSDRWSVQLDGDVEILSGDDNGATEAPDIDLWHYHIGLQFNLLDPNTSNFLIQPRAGLGGTTLDTDDFPGTVDDDFSETYFSIDGGIDFGWQANEAFAFGVGGKVFIAFADEEDTQVFNQFSDELDPEGFDTAVSVPIYAFIRWTPGTR